MSANPLRWIKKVAKSLLGTAPRRSRRKRPETAHRAPKLQRPALEFLEDRITPTNWVVSVSTPDSAATVGTLRYAVTSAVNGDTISFASSLNGSTITLASSLTIATNVSIIGPGAANLTISGTNSFVDVIVNSGVTASISGLTVTNGLSTIGAGIRNLGTLSLANDTVSGNGSITNTGTHNGAGIYSSGTMTITGTTISNNSNYWNGGGIMNTGTMTVSDSTIAGNYAYTYGGGIYNTGTLTLSNDTITGNKGWDNVSSYPEYGGGIYTTGTLNMANTIVAGNNSGSIGPDIDGTATSGNNNIVGNGSGMTGLTNGTNGNQVGVSSPGVGILAYNGGPTQTQALQSGSPAIGAGAPVTTVPAAGIAATGNSFAVTNAAFIGANATPGTYLIQIDSEQMLVTGISSGNMLTVIRGYNGTTPAAHNSGAGVFLEVDERGYAVSTTTPDIGAYQTTGTAPGTPTVTSMNPVSGTPAGGTSVTITGTNLQNTTAVNFGGLPGTIVSDSGTAVVATTPAEPNGPVDTLITTVGYDNTAPVLADLYTFTNSTTTAYGDSLDGNGNLIITPEIGSDNDNLTFSLSNGNYTFTDSGGLTFDTPVGAGGGNITGAGTSTISIPSTAVTSIRVVLGTATNTLTLTGTGGATAAPLAMSAGTTAGDQVIIAGAVLDSGALSLFGNTVNETSSGSLNAGSVSLSATGAITQQGTLPVITSSGLLSLTAGSIGTATQPLAFSAASLTSNTAGGPNGNQFLNNAGTVALSSASALNAGTGTISLTSGTFQLQAANATGSTTSLSLSSQATLDLNGNSTTIGALNGSGTVIDSNGAPATLTVSGGGSFSGTINGASTGLSVSGASQTLTLSGTNTYGGATTVSGGGALSVSSDANLGTAPAGPTAGSIVLNGGTLKATAGFILNSNRGIALGPTTGTGTGTIDVSGSANTLVYGGILANNGTGTGNLAKTDTGVLSLSGTNTYTGSTTISAGTLQLAGASALPTGTNVADNGTLDLDSNSVSIGTLSGTGNVIDSGTAATLTVMGGGSLSGNITGASTALTVAGTTQTLALSGTNTFAGATTVNGGVLTVNGTETASAITVNSGATLGGSGTTGSVTAASGGTINPGNPVANSAILTTGATNLSAGGNYTLEIPNFSGPGATGFDKVAISGALTLGGSSSLTLDLSGLTTTGTANIITYTSLTGNFATITTINNTNNFVPIINYGATGISITFVAQDAATHLAVSAPTPVTAGSPFSITVTALDANNFQTTGYTGTVTFTSTDPAPGITLPPNTSGFTATGAVTLNGVILDTAGSRTITATDTVTPTMTGVSGAIIVNAGAPSKLVYTTTAQALTAGVTSGTITVQLEDAFSNLATAATAQTVSLTTNSSGGQFRDNATGNTAITSVTIASGSGTASFKYNDTLAGSHVLTVTDSALTNPTATQTETVSAAAPNKLVYTTTAQTLTAGVTSGTITVQLEDPFNNVATAAGTQTIVLATSSSGGQFRDNATGNTTITYVLIATGASSASFKYNDTVAASPTLMAMDFGLTNTTATQTETVSAAAPSKLVYTTTAQALTAGVTSGTITVQLEDPFNNVATAASTQTISLSTSSTGGQFRDNATGNTQLTSVTIASGLSSASFKYNDTLAGSPTLTVTDIALTTPTATQTETIAAAGASKLAFTTTAQSLTAGVISGTITVQLEDPFNNAATAGTAQTVNLTNSSSGGQFRDNATGNTSITSVTIASGASSASFKYNDTLAGSPTLTATDSALTNPTATQTETVSAASAAKLVYTTAAQSLTAGVTSGTITVQLEDSFNNVVAAATTQTVLLTTTSSSGQFRDNATGNTGIIFVTIPAGSNSASFKYNDTLVGSPVLTATDNALTSPTATQTETVAVAAASQLVYTTTAQALTAGVTSGTTTVQLEDPFNNVATAGTAQTINLTTTSSGGQFRDNATGNTSITSVTIASGASSASFKYNDTLAGSPVLTVTDSALTTPTATQTETVTAAAASKLVFTTTAQTLTAGSTSGTITVQLDDPFNNVATAASTQTINLTTSSSGQFRDNATGNTSITSVTIASGASSASFKYNDTVAGSPTLTASDSALTNPTATQTETVNAAAPNKLVFTTTTQALTAGATSGTITVQLEDPFNNVVAAGSTQTINLTTTSSGGQFRDNATGNTSISSVTIASGSSSASFKYNDTLANSPTLTATDSALTNPTATQAETVSAAAASKLVFTTTPRTLTAGVTSDTITVQLADPFNNVATAASTQTINLTTSSSGQFRDNATGNTTITSVTIASGSSSASFKYNDTLAGSPTLTATDSALTNPTATQTETVTAATPSKLVFTTTPETLTAAVTSGTITVQLEDPFNNVATAASTQTVSLTTSSSAGQFRDNATGNTTITSVTIASGSSSASFKYNDTLAGNPVLTATDSALTNPTATQTETVSAAAANKLAFVVQPSNTAGGAAINPAVRVAVEDQFGNVLTTDETDQVTVSVASGPGGFATGSATTATVQNGVATFNNLYLTTAGSYTLGDSATGSPTSTNSNAFNVTLAVTSFTATPTGFVATFSQPFNNTSNGNTAQINLYNSASSNDGAADVTLVSNTTGKAITGSLVIDPSNQKITFIKTTEAGTNGLPLANDWALLPADTYTATIVSGSSAFETPGGSLLDGLSNGTAGSGNFTTTFTVSPLTPSTVVATVPDFARGPDATDLINVPNNSSPAVGIPIDLTQLAPTQTVAFSSGITSGSFRLSFDGTNTGSITWSNTTTTLATNIKNALAALTSVGTGNVNVSVTGTTQLTATVTFAATVANPALMTVGLNSLSPSGSTISITNPNADTVTSATFTLDYNANLLTISGGTVNPSLTGATFTVTTSGSGSSAQATITFQSTAGVNLGSSASLLLGGLTATVPANAAYKSKDLLHFDLSSTSNNTVNGGATPVVTADGLHVVAFFGDTTGLGTTYTSADSTNIVRVAGKADTGFGAFPLVDPVILGNLSDTGLMNSGDATDLNSLLSGGSPAQIPPYPGTPSNNPSGPDPTVSIPSVLSVGPGGVVLVPVDINEPVPAANAGMTLATLALQYDPAKLSVLADDVQLGSVPGSGTGWTLQVVVNQATGELGITLFSAEPITDPAGGSLVTIAFHVNGTAAAGTTAVELVSSVNPSGYNVISTAVADTAGLFTLSPAPTGGAESSEGVVTILGPAPAAAPVSSVAAPAPVAAPAAVPALEVVEALSPSAAPVVSVEDGRVEELVVPPVAAAVSNLPPSVPMGGASAALQPVGPATAAEDDVPAPGDGGGTAVNPLSADLAAATDGEARSGLGVDTAAATPVSAESAPVTEEQPVVAAAIDVPAANAPAAEDSVAPATPAPEQGGDQAFALTIPTFAALRSKRRAPQPATGVNVSALDEYFARIAADLKRRDTK